jgi:hypothetical protein
MLRGRFDAQILGMPKLVPDSNESLLCAKSLEVNKPGFAEDFISRWCKKNVFFSYWVPQDTSEIAVACEPATDTKAGRSSAETHPTRSLKTMVVWDGSLVWPL